MQRSFGQNAVDFLGWVKQRFYGRRSLLLFLVFLVPFLNALMSPPQAVSAANTGLIISPDADGRVDMSVSGISKYETFAGHPAANATQAATEASAFKNWETWKKSTHTYVNFKSGPHMHGIGFTGEPMTSTNFSVAGKQISGTISLNYHNIGLYNFATTGKPNLQTVGAKITITNIVTGPQPSFAGSTRPYIVFSDNLYSGVVYGGIKSMTMTVEVYNAQTGATVNFGSDNSSVFGFNSLNHNDNKDQYAEFASSGSGVAGQLSSPTNMKKAGAGGVVSGAGYSKNAYWGSSNNFADHLGSATFEKNAVSFPMHGTSNTFTFGSLYGRAWNAFSSSAVYPTYQNMPTKTVEPVKQFVTGDPWYQYTGSDNGWEQRYDNDLDRYHVAGDGVAPDFGVTSDVNMPWDFTNPQVGHNPDAGSLSAGVLPKANRYVVNGGSYYYYINQPTINLQTQGLILPSGYEISDQLPAGTTFESATLYNLNGTIISNPFSNQPSAGATKLNFKFTDAATNAINEASRIEANFGKDFTLRIRFKVNNVANTDNINDVMSNKATSKFHYTQLGNETYDADSNAVQIKVKDALVKLDFIKQDEAGQPLAGAIFGLFDKDGKQIGENITSDKDGKFSFSGKTSELPDGTYTLEEITPPSGYDKVADITVVVKNGQIDFADSGKELTDPDQDGVGNITDKRSPYELQLKKVGTDGKVLAGAEFILTDDKGNQIPGATKITSGEDGLISFGKDFDWTKTYYFKETQAPAGHKLDNSVYKVTFDQAKGQATLTNLTTAKETIVTIKDGIAQFTITNEFKDLSLRIKKIDSETNELLAGAEFTLTGPDGKTTVVTSKNVDGQDWNIEFKNLKPGTYKLKETKAPDGYELDNTEHKVVIAQDGSVTYDDKKLDQITNDANTIIVGTPEIGNSPQKVMPHTGGSGIGSFMMIASVLLGLATILLVTTYVKRQEVRDHD